MDPISMRARSINASLALLALMEQRAPGDVESREFFNEEIAKLGSKREDIQTWADLLDLDDYVSYGGKP